MAIRDKFPSSSEQMVTSSALVRQFGLWQDRASRAPVFILHRGRPRLVLTSVEAMDALCAPHDHPDESVLRQRDALLDGTMAPTLLADDAGRLLAIGRAARAQFGLAAGDDVSRIAPHDPFLALTAIRVAGTRQAETVKVRRDGRRYECVIEPYPGGIAVFLNDVTDAGREREAAAEQTALSAAAVADGGVALVRINLRGYIEAPDPSLAAFTGVPSATLAEARFTSIVTADTRVAVGTALEVAARGRPTALDAAVLVNHASPRPVRLSVAPVLGRRGVAAVSALLRER